jgi:sulfur carrier protein
MSSGITVNGNLRDDLEPGLSIVDLVIRHGLPEEGRGVAVALDGEVVPRAQWSSTLLEEGSAIELVQAIQGG